MPLRENTVAGAVEGIDEATHIRTTRKLGRRSSAGLEYASFQGEGGSSLP